MKSFQNRMNPWSVLLLLVGTFSSSCLAEVETWTSVSGATIDAEFVELRNGLAILKTAEGKEVGISPLKLDEAARVRIETVVQEASGKAEGAKEQRGPGVFKELQFPNYDAVLRVPNGQMLIYPKHNGVRVGDTIEVNVQGRYSDGGGRKSRVPVSLIEEPEWVNDHAVFKLLMTDEVLAELYYRFEPGKIEMGYRIDEPKGVTRTDDYRIQLSFSGLLKYDGASETYSGNQYPEPMSRGRVKEVLKDTKIVIKPIKGKKETYAFTDSIDHFPGPSKSIEIFRAYKGMDLRADAPSKGYIWARIYQGGEPMGGYSIAYRKDKIKGPVNKPNELMTLTIGP